MKYFLASEAVRAAIGRTLDAKTRWILAATEIELLVDEVRFHGPTKIDFYVNGDRCPFPSEILTLHPETEDDSDTDDYQPAS